ncbi:MAG TPA: hypothetical protein VFT49_02990 [Candidatus Saccharimonadales bacterium]|nr:hypothetical protein [Candidatus Saccharimonadales bacterium]
MSEQLKLTTAMSPAIEPVQFEPIFSTSPEEPPRALFSDDDSLIVRELTQAEIDSKLFPVDSLGMPLVLFVPASHRTEFQNEMLVKDEEGTSREEQGEDDSQDRHHLYGPENELRKKGDNLNKALRYSRVQRVPVKLHKRFTKDFERTPLPKTRIARIGKLLLMAARYIGPEAVDVRPSIPVIRRLTLAERQYMWAHNEVWVENVKKVQDIIINQVVKQKIPDIHKYQDEVLDFLTCTNEEDKIKLGRRLFRVAAKAAVEPIEIDYLRAWDGGLLPRQRLDPPKKSEPAATGKRKKKNNKKQGISTPRAYPKQAHIFIARHVVQDPYKEKEVIKSLSNELDKRLGHRLAV